MINGAIFRLGVYLDLIDRLSSPLGRVQDRLRQVELASERARTSLDRLGTGAALMGAGAALAAPLVLATRAAMGFEEAFADVRKVVDAPAPALAALQRELLNLTRYVPMTARNLTEIAAAAGQAGIPVVELTEFVRDAARVGTAFGISAAAAGDALAKLRTALELSQPQVRLLADAVNTLSNNLAATAPEILDVLRRVGATGKLLGLSGQQVAAFGSALLAVGTAPEVAATGLNALFSRLATASAQPKEFQRALGALGLTASGLQSALRRDAAGAITDFLRRLQAVPDRMERLRLLSGLFGQEYADDIARLVGSLATLDKALGLVRSPASYAGSALEEFQNRSRTLANGLVLLRNAVERLWIALGNTLLPVVTPVVKGLTEMLNRVGDLLDRYPALRVAVVGAAAALGGLLVVGGAAVAALATLGFASAQARLGLLALQGGAASLLRQLRLLSLGLGLLRGQLALLGPLGLLRAGLLGLQQASLLAGRGVLFLGRAVLMNPLGLLLGLLGGVGYALTAAWRHSEAFRQSVLETLGALRAAFAPALAEFRALGQTLAGLFRPVAGAVEASLGAVPAVLDRVLYGVFYGLGFAFGLLQGLLGRLAPVIGDGLRGVAQVVRGVVDVVVGLFTLDLSRAVAGALRVWEGLRAILSVPIRLGGVVWDALKGGLQGALAWLRGLAGAFVEAGRALVQGLARGIAELALAPVNAVRQIGADAVARLKAVLGIRSPSAVFARLGAMTALGMAVGLQGMAPKVQEAAEGLMRVGLEPLRVPVVAEAPRLPEVPSPAPSAAPGPAPARGEGRVVQVVRIERLELPQVRDAEEFLEALKRLLLPYAEV